MSIMSENSEIKLLGNNISFANPYDIEAFTWKITNISSIVHEVDNVLRSPPFSFDNETWILKMYPYGQTVINSTGFIDVVIERLCRQVGKYEVFVRIFCKDVFGKEIHIESRNYNYAETLNEPIKMHNFMRNIKDHPNKSEIAPNDTFTLVCELGKEVKDLKKQDSQEKSAEPNLGAALQKIKHEIDSKYEEADKKLAIGEISKFNRNSGIPEVGEIFKEYFLLQSFFWKLCEIPPSAPNGYKIQSKEFSFAGAIWILKVYPYYRMKHSNNPSYDVVLERLQTEVSEHYIMLKIGTKDQVQQTTFFQALPNGVAHTQSDAINFPSQGEIFLKKGCLHFGGEIKFRKNARYEFQVRLKQLTAANGNTSGSEVLQDSKELKKEDCDITQGSCQANASGSKVLQDLKELYLKKEDCDVTIKVKGIEFPAHRVILKARSPVLAFALRIDMKEKTTGIIDIEDCDPSSFSDFLCFIYSGEIENLSERNVFSLFTAADKYDISDLRAMCLEFMKQNLSVDTFCDTIASALLHSETELIQLSTDFFVKNTLKIVVTVKWQSFILENPLQGNELYIKALTANRYQQ